MSMTSSEKMGLSGDGWVEGETEGTEWIPESTAKFITYNVSEADRREHTLLKSTERETKRYRKIQSMKLITAL